MDSRFHHFVLPQFGHSNESFWQYFPEAPSIMLDKVVLTFESVDEILSVTIQLKATEQYFPVVLFIMLYKVVLTFESVDAILKCDQSFK